jgi:hypothetical protein
MFHLVASWLRAQGWSEWSVAQIQTDSLVWWIFAPGAAAPTVIGKLPRTALDVEIARREAAALAALEPVAEELHVPRLLFQTDLDDGSFLFLQSGLTGVPLADRADHFDLILSWLDRFQSSVPAAGTLEEAVRCAIALCRTKLPRRTAAEERLLNAAGEAAPGLGAFAATAVHGDFWTGNVLRVDKRLAVVDWSNYHPGSPLEDLHNFAAAQGYESRGGADQRMQSMWRVFFGKSPLALRTREFTTRILAARGLPHELLQPLFLLFLVRRIGCIEFSNHAAWRRFAERYVEAGLPAPFSA